MSNKNRSQTFFRFEKQKRQIKIVYLRSIIVNENRYQHEDIYHVLF